MVIVEGPIITVIAGFLSSIGHLNLFAVYAVVVVGDLVGDSLYYALGYYGRKNFIERWGHFLGITVKRIERLEKHFKKHSGKTLIIGKLTNAIGAVLLVAAGVARIPFRKFIWYNFIPTLPKSLILLLIGYFFGETYNKINTYLDYTAIITIGLSIIFIVIHLTLKRVSAKYGSKDL
jgi:membrane protein DedA with SNARE-associated domain